VGLLAACDGELVEGAAQTPAPRVPPGLELAEPTVSEPAVLASGPGTVSAGVFVADDPARDLRAAAEVAPLPARTMPSPAPMESPGDGTAQASPDAPGPEFDERVAQFDAQRDRAYVPGLGWRPSGEVLEVYRERPHELPADTDLYELHRLVAVIEAAR
jgi:hypothetical protein